MRLGRKQRQWLVFVAFAARIEHLRTSVHQARIRKRAKMFSMALNYAAGRAFFRWKQAASEQRRKRCSAMLRLWFRKCHKQRTRIRRRRAANLLVKFLQDQANADVITKGVRRLVATVTRVKMWWLRR